MPRGLNITLHTSDSISDSGIGKGDVEDDDDSFQSVAADDFAETDDASAGATLVVYGIFCGIGFVVILVLRSESNIA